MSVLRLLSFLLILQFNTPTFSKRISGVYVDNGFNQTILHEVLSQRQRIELEEEMLNIFDIPEKPPHIQRKLPLIKRSAPMFLMDVYKMLDENEGAQPTNIDFQNSDSFDITGENLKTIKESNIIMSLAAQNHKAPGINKVDKVKRLWFNVTYVFPDDEIINAELRLYRSVHSVRNKRKQGPITITVYRILTARADDGSREKLFVDTVNTTENDGWVTLNITESLHYWVQRSHVNRGLYLAVHSHDHPHRPARPEDFGIVGFRDDPEKRPFMVGYFKRTKEKRMRKTDFSFLGHNSSHKNLIRLKRSTACKKESLYVNFQDLNWQDWIIQPRGYDAHFCHGECNFPLQNHLIASNHAIVQSLINLKNPNKAPKPCCAPSKLTSISVIYRLDDENYVMRNREDMAVKSCACH